jgi:hypothetical protein
MGIEIFRKMTSGVRVAVVEPASSPSNQSNPKVRISGLALGDEVEVFTSPACGEAERVGAAVSQGAEIPELQLTIPQGKADGDLVFYVKYKRQSTQGSGQSGCIDGRGGYELDRTQPILSFGPEPDPDTLFYNGNWSFACSEACRISTALVQSAALLGSPNPSWGPWSANWLTDSQYSTSGATSLSDGWHYLHVIAIDRAGNVADERVSRVQISRPPLPAFSYPSTGVVLTQWQGLSAPVNAIVASGSGPIASCTTDAGGSQLLADAGVSLNASNCQIARSGTSVAVNYQLQAVVRVTATNLAGSVTADLPLRVNATTPVLGFNPSSLTVQERAPFNSGTPTVSAGEIASCTGVNLPSGVSVNSSTCAVSGALAAHGSYSITVSALNPTGQSATAVLTVVVNQAPPVISYPGSPYDFVRGAPIQITATRSGGPIASCSAQGAPQGVVVDPTSCGITGQISAVGSFPFTVVAQNASGQTGQAQLTIRIRDLDPQITFVPASQTVTRLQAFRFAPTLAGGAVSSCSGTLAGGQALPAGVSVHPSTCAVSGSFATTGNYVIQVTATNSTGQAGQGALTITVQPISPVLSYPASTIAVVGEDLNISPTVTGDAPVTCTLQPIVQMLPAGLTLNSDCSISGTPSAESGVASYTVVGGNPGGSSEPAVLSLGVVFRPELTFPQRAYSLAKGLAMRPIFGAAIGTQPLDQCEATNLPVGLSLRVSGATCEISGTPSAAVVAQTLTVHARRANFWGQVVNLTLTVRGSTDLLKLAHSYNEELNDNGVGRKMHANDRAFAALTVLGGVRTWGDAASGGGIDIPPGPSNTEVMAITPNRAAFALLRANGSVRMLGHCEYGGPVVAGCQRRSGQGDADTEPFPASTIGPSAPQPLPIVAISSTEGGFAALRGDTGTVITWGRRSDVSAVIDIGACSPAGVPAIQLASGVREIFVSANTLFALKNDGTVAFCGGLAGPQAQTIGLSSSGAGIVSIAANRQAAAFLYSDGSVATRGAFASGGDHPIASGVVELAATQSAFAARKANGSVEVWGDSRFGGRAGASASLLLGVTQIYSNAVAFLARRSDGTLVNWGSAGTQGYIAMPPFSGRAALSAAGEVVRSLRAFLILDDTHTPFAFGEPSEGGEMIPGSQGTQAYHLDPHYYHPFLTFDVRNWPLYKWAASAPVAMALVKDSGLMNSYGDASKGGDSSSVNAPYQLPGAELAQVDAVRQIASTSGAFAVINARGQLFTWGELASGGDSTRIAEVSLDHGSPSAPLAVISAAATHAPSASGSIFLHSQGQVSGSLVATAPSHSAFLHSGLKLVSNGGAVGFLNAQGDAVTLGSSLYGGGEAHPARVAELSNPRWVVDLAASGGVNVGKGSIMARQGFAGVYSYGPSEAGGAVAFDLEKLQRVIPAKGAYVGEFAHGAWGASLPTGSAGSETGAVMFSTPDSATDGVHSVQTAGDWAYALSGLGELLKVRIMNPDGVGKVPGAVDVKSFAVNDDAVAYIRADGSVGASGVASVGGLLTGSITNAESILAVTGQFFVKKANGDVVTWDSTGKVNLVTTGVRQWAANSGAVFMLREDSAGGAVTLAASGDPAFGGSIPQGIEDLAVPYRLIAEGAGVAVIGYKSSSAGAPAAGLLLLSEAGSRTGVIAARELVQGTARNAWILIHRNGAALEIGPDTQIP